MDLYTEGYDEVWNLSENEKKCNAKYSQQDKELLCQQINRFQKKFYEVLKKLGNTDREYADKIRYCGYQIDILPTNSDWEISDFLKHYIGYDYLNETDFHRLGTENIQQIYADMLDKSLVFKNRERLTYYAKSLKELFEELFGNDILEVCHIGSDKYVICNTNLFYVVFDVYCIRYKKYTLVVSTGNDE